MQNIIAKKSGRDEGLIQKKNKSGKIDWYARITRTLPDGSKKQYARKADDKTHARKLLRELEEKYDNYGNKGIEGERLTFRELAGIYKKRHLVEATYVQNSDGRRKVAGLKNTIDPVRFLETLISYLGNIRLKELTHSDIETFKHQRLEKPVIHERIIRKKDPKTKVVMTETVKTEKPRKISSVNRELEQLRAVLRFAVRQGWVLRSPMDLGKVLISKADENKRERVLSHDEESRLLEVCIDKRTHLKPIIICALDTGMRKGEMLKLVWADVDLTSGIIKVKAQNSKTERPRTVPMTPRLKAELIDLADRKKPSANDSVFGIQNNIKRSFATACRLADIDDFRLHDCRHTAVTRMVAAGIPAEKVMKISGHSEIRTFLRYLNPTVNDLTDAAEKLANFNLINNSIINVVGQSN